MIDFSHVCRVKTRIIMGLGNCGRLIVRDNKCIFHLENKTEEEAKKFENEFLIEFKKMEGNYDELHFDNFIFPNPINFCLYSKIFKKPIFFTGAHFIKQAEFTEVEFYDEADFSEAEFDDEANFWKAKFIKKSNFLRIKFNNNAYFDDAIFRDDADFGWAKFGKGAYFHTTQFDKKADFYASTFENEGLFTRIIFNNESFIKLRYSRFLKPKYVRFYNVDLSFFSFLCTDITEVEFLDEKWAKKNGRCIVRDDSEILKELDTTYNAVAQLYRRLRRNYENNYRFAEAGDFFMGEMEMLRLDVTARFSKKNKILNKIELWFELSLLNIYKYLSLYGESYFRPAICALIVIIFVFV